MREKIIAEIYAKALLAAAKHRKEMDSLADEIESLFPVITAKIGLGRFLQSPRISLEKKYAVVEQVLKGKVSELLLSLLWLLLKKKRIEYGVDILKEYLRLVDAEQGVITAKIITAKPLDNEKHKDLIRSITSQIERITEKKVRLERVVDSRIIAGAIVSFEDTLIDGSIRNKLNKLRDTLLATPVH
ncbi:MAG: ATP synthase F1 subunit delta [bacterium]|nr:ATP synthase F1 subunit delta [bacterium]